MSSRVFLRTWQGLPSPSGQAIIKASSKAETEECHLIPSKNQTSQKSFMVKWPDQSPKGSNGIWCYWGSRKALDHQSTNIPTDKDGFEDVLIASDKPLPKQLKIGQQLLKITSGDEPIVITIQETFLGNNCMITLNGYNGICKLGHYSQRS